MVTRIAVVGGGAAGLTAASLLHRTHEVTLFEREPALGGHATTVTAPDGTPLDVGFMVLNDRNYPAMHALLDGLPGVRLAPSEMSFGYHGGGVSYALNGGGAPRPGDPLAALMGEIVRFMRVASRDVEAGLGDETLRAYFARRGCSERLVGTYLLPMGAAIWSAAPDGLLDCPAAFVLGFYRHHGMLSVGDAPGWLHLAGGSRTYVEALHARLGGGVRVAAPVTGVRRDGGGAWVTAGGVAERFDAVVVATHADAALGLLEDADDAERGLLGPWRYQPNRCVLHGDPAAMPADRRHWAAWNFAWEPGAEPGRGPTVTYHLNRLQGLPGPDWFLTLNPRREPGAVLREFAFRHPVYDAAAIATQPALAAQAGARDTWFCGSYAGFGFHEDAIRAGARVAAALGGERLP